MSYKRKGNVFLIFSSGPQNPKFGGGEPLRNGIKRHRIISAYELVQAIGLLEEWIVPILGKAVKQFNLQNADINTSIMFGKRSKRVLGFRVGALFMVPGLNHDGHLNSYGNSLIQYRSPPDYFSINAYSFDITRHLLQQVVGEARV